MEAAKEYFKPFQRLAKLYIQTGKLTLTEVLTRILAGALIAFVCLLFAIISLTFISYGVINTLTQTMSMTWACLIVGGFYLFIIILMIVFKRTLIINPIARFLSKIIIDAPDSPKISANEEE